jgi:hypothetical protein
MFIIISHLGKVLYTRRIFKMNANENQETESLIKHAQCKKHITTLKN